MLRITIGRGGPFDTAFKLHRTTNLRVFADPESVMTELELLVDRYCAAWSSTLPQERAALLQNALTEDATYCDSRTAELGVPDLIAHIARVQETRPGARILRTSHVDAHHGLARFHWQVALPDGSRLPEGIDFIELSPDGTRIRRIVGFFGPLKPAGQ